MEKVFRKNELPESVRLAKARGDHEALRQLGKMGNQRKAILQSVRAQDAERKAFVDLAYSRAFDLEVQRVLAAEREREFWDGAIDHAKKIDPNEQEY
jgi:hypothetical protein